jgi:hypothetical protein
LGSFREWLRTDEVKDVGRKRLGYVSIDKDVYYRPGFGILSNEQRYYSELRIKCYHITLVMQNTDIVQD